MRRHREALRSGVALPPSPPGPSQHELHAERVEPQVARSVEAQAHRLGLGRSLVYRALSEDEEYRDGLPLLPSIKVGARRLIRDSAADSWLASLETRPSCRRVA